MTSRNDGTDWCVSQAVFPFFERIFWSTGKSDSFVPNAAGERDDFAPHQSKSVPQRLKPSSAQTITARLNPCPSFDSLFPSLSGAVQIGQPKNLIWTEVKFSRPRSTSSGQALRDSIAGHLRPD
jgi:hypothetical protein